MATAVSQSSHPPIVWAQTKGSVLVTIATDDLSDIDIKFTSHSFSVEARSASSAVRYSADIELFAEIKPDQCSYLKHRRWTITLVKADETSFWPRLNKDKVKLPFVSIDWQKWKDEDELESHDMLDMPSGMENLDFGGGAGELPDLSDLNDN